MVREASGRFLKTNPSGMVTFNPKLSEPVRF